MRDPLTQPATDDQVARFAGSRGISFAEARATLDRLREKQIALRKADPLGAGYEPPIWYVVKSLIRNPVWTDMERAYIRKRLGQEWTAEIFAERMRKRLGFTNPVTKMLVMGSNRSGKTDFSSKLCVETLRQGDKFVCSGAQTLKTQKKLQMARMWHYFPKVWKDKNIATGKAKDVVENISYTQKNGFAGSSAVFDNGSLLNFVSYEQTVASLEGAEYDLVWLDEEYGIEFYNLMTTRITSRAGVFLGTFTPLHGYTPQIARFLDGRQVTRWHTAWLRPNDGGPKLPWEELNLRKDEYEELTSWRRKGMQGDCDIPESRPEDCFEWLFDEGDGRNSVRVPAGRSFDCTPRVCVCQGGEAAAVWFYGSDNPYGLPAELMATKMADENAEKQIYAAIYGMAASVSGSIFKTFIRDRNVIRDVDLPGNLVRFMIVDPAPERNWVMAWAGYDPMSGTLYFYREWPGNYEIPGQGVPGKWVVPSDRNGGLNDGARGDAQVSFGFGYNHIKFEIARLEGWTDYERWIASGRSIATMPPDLDDFIGDWDEVDGVREEMEFRILDSRAASQSKISMTGNHSLIEDLETLMSGWQVADGQKLEIGYSRINDKLATGKIKICESCTNIIECIEKLTGKDGQKGAAKDFVDLVRYATMSDIWNYTADAARPIGFKETGGISRVMAPVERMSGQKRRRVWW